MSGGQGCLKPSPGNFFVASMPSLLPAEDEVVEDAFFILIHQPIPVVTLMRFVAEVFDEAMHVSHGHAKRRARL